MKIKNNNIIPLILHEADDHQQWKEFQSVSVYHSLEVSLYHQVNLKFQQRDLKIQYENL